MLPEWLGEFGDYAITAEAKVESVANERRWFSLVLRAQNENGSGYPYYHVCARENTTLENGVEFAQKTPSNTWNVVRAAGATLETLQDDYHVFAVRACGTEFSYSIDSEEVLTVGRAQIGTRVPEYETGLVGLTMNRGRVALKSVRVTVQAAELESGAEDSSLLNGLSAENVLRNPVANVLRVEGDAAESLSGAGGGGVFLFSAQTTADLGQAFELCREKGLVGTVCVASVAEADRFLSAARETEWTDLTAVSPDGEVLRYIREKEPSVRTGLVLGQTSGESAEQLREKIRSALATFCILDGPSATRALVSQLQELSVAVWVEVTEEPGGEDYTVGALRALTSGANGVVTRSAEALSDVIRDHFAARTMTRTPLVIAHRGSAKTTPENSLSGFRAAYENGCDMLEFDVQITADGQVVVLHDASLNRTTDYTGEKSINEMTLEEVRRYRLRNPDGSLSDETVPTLAEVIEAFAKEDCKFLMELKGADARVVTAAAEVIRSTDSAGRFNFLSFNEEYLARARSVLPGVSTGHLIASSGTSYTDADALTALAPALENAGKQASSINTDNGVFTVLYEAAATDRGLTVWPYTYNASTNNAAFLSACDGMTTDDVQWAKDMAKSVRCDDTITLGKNSDVTPAVLVETYAGEVSEVAPEDLIVRVVQGEGLVRTDGEALVSGNAGGEAVVLFGYSAKTADGSEYVLYTEPVTLRITSSFFEMPDGVFPAVCLLLSGGLYTAGAFLAIRNRRSVKGSTPR